MRYLLDTCIMLYMVRDTGEMSSDVEAVVNDYGNQLYICAASIREIVAAWYKYEDMRRNWKSPEDVVQELTDQLGIQVLYPQREHYETFIHLQRNVAEKHTDTTDHLIIAHAITEKMTLISSDTKFDFYCNQGLDYFYNKK